MRSGQSYILINGSGMVEGQYFIESMSETYSGFFENGAARKIEFSLVLKRTDNNASTLGAISDYIGNVMQEPIQTVKSVVSSTVSSATQSITDKIGF